jgi:glycosyltransferase involved in cell wall biosynthesis
MHDLTVPARKPVRVLFNVYCGRDNFNAQSLNARDIGLRLPSESFELSYFLAAGGVPDPRLTRRGNVVLIPIPGRGGSFQQAWSMLTGGHDWLVYPSTNTIAGRWFWRGRTVASSRTKVVEPLEMSWAQLERVEERGRDLHLRSIRRADVRVAITPQVQEEYRRGTGMDSVLLPVGVDCSLFPWADRSDREPPLRVLFVGTFQRRKRPEMILDLAATDFGMPVEYHLVGYAINTESLGHQAWLRGEVQRRGLRNVRFHGPLDQAGVSRMMAESDIFILPSRLESFGKVTLEAAATGLPCLVFSDYRTPVVVDGVTGYQLHEDGDLPVRLGELLASRDLRLSMGRAGSELAREFDWDRIAPRWAALLSCSD